MYIGVKHGGPMDAAAAVSCFAGFDENLCGIEHEAASPHGTASFGQLKQSAAA